jgi:hypothetical protein
MTGLARDRRRGRFRVLPHINEGFDPLPDGSFVKTAANLRNRQLAELRFPSIEIAMPLCKRVELSAIKTDGLSSLDFSIVSRDAMADAGGFSVEKITVEI